MLKMFILKEDITVTDDIVTRLRVEKQNCLLMNNGNPFLLVDVIDEIERLRKSLEQCMAERDTWKELYYSSKKSKYDHS